MKNGIIILWITSVIAAFSLGFFSKPNQKVSPTIEENKSNSKAQITALITAKNGIKSNDIAIKEVPQAITSPLHTEKNMVEVISALKSLSKNPMVTDFANLTKAYELTKELNEQEIIEALTLLNTDNKAHPTSLLMLLSRYAEVSPENALAYTTDNIKGQSKLVATITIISTWANNAPTETYEWYKNKQQDDSYQPAMLGQEFELLSIFGGLASNNLQDAVYKLSELSDDNSKVQMAVMGITTTLSQSHEYKELLAATEQFDNKNIADNIVAQWAAKDVQASIAWLNNIEDTKQKITFKDSILQSWMMTEPESAANWYIAEVNDNNSKKSVGKIINYWTYQNPKSALTWITKQVNIDQEDSITKVLQASMYKNTSFVIDNLSLLENEKSKIDLSLSIYNTLLHNSDKKAQAFLNSSPYKFELKQKIATK